MGSVFVPVGAVDFVLLLCWRAAASTCPPNQASDSLSLLGNLTLHRPLPLPRAGGVLAELDPAEAAALLSALVYKEKSSAPPALTPRRAAARDAAAALALAAGEAQRDAGLDVDPDEFVAATLNFGLMEAVHEWARGTPFREICALTDAMEGSVVRTMVRLDETCRELRDAARVMGDVALFQQMEAASAAIKRDIVFAASLYVA